MFYIFLVTNLLSKLLRNIYKEKYYIISIIYPDIGKRGRMKKYLLLIEDQKMWEKFKELIKQDINTEIISLIEEKIKKKDKGDKNDK